MELKYNLIKSNRKTISLTLEVNNDIVIKAPLEAEEERINDFFERKKIWIYTKMEEKKYLINCPEKKEFVNWEWFYYLWRMYKLKVIESENIDLKLRFYKNKFELNKKYISIAKELFIDFYIEKFNLKILPKIKEISKENNFNYSEIKIKNLKNKWWTCSKDNNIKFHWKVMLAPISVIEYIIIHEFCHIKIKNHSPKFWDLLKRYLPKYEEQKNWLKINWWEFEI